MAITGQRPTTGTPYELPFAGFWTRITAFAVDIGLVALVSTLVSFTEIEAVLPDFWLLSEPWYAIALLYFAGMESSGVAGTLGKWLRGIRVTSADGQGIPFVKALLRNLIKTVGILVIGLGVIRIIWNEQKQGWHDELVGSFVVAGK